MRLDQETKADESLAKDTFQQRTGVKKEIWTLKNGQRVLFRLESESSDLTLHPTNNKFEIREQLHNISCCMQEEISIVNEQNVQEIRTLYAKEGTYLFPSHQFTTDSVDLKFFRLIGNTLPIYPLTNTPYLSGHAFAVAFGANNKSLEFTADYLKADLDPKQVFQQDL